MANRELTACIHSTSAKSLQGGSIKRIDSVAAAHVSGIPEISRAAAPSPLLFLPCPYQHPFKTRPIRPGAFKSLGSNPRGAVRDAGGGERTRVPGLFLPICAFAAPSGVQTLFLLENKTKLIYQQAG